jgi:hypothetical protein
MENISVINNAGNLSGNPDIAGFGTEKKLNGKSNFGSNIINMLSEGGANFINYLKSINLSKDNDLLVLSSDHHYFYDERELKNVKTLVNLRKLNQVKNLDSFLHNLFDILPPDANFIGCFSDDKTKNGSSFSFYAPSRLFSRFINFIDSRTDQILDRDEVSELLENYGFKVVSMTTLDGLTYFHSKSPSRPVRLSA